MIRIFGTRPADRPATAYVEVGTIMAEVHTGVVYPYAPIYLDEAKSGGHLLVGVSEEDGLVCWFECAFTPKNFVPDGRNFDEIPTIDGIPVSSFRELVEWEDVTHTYVPISTYIRRDTIFFTWNQQEPAAYKVVDGQIAYIVGANHRLIGAYVQHLTKTEVENVEEHHDMDRRWKIPHIE